MTIYGYGVWAGLPTRYYAEHASQQDPTPHTYLYFRDDNNAEKEREAAINVKSRGEDSRLVSGKDENHSYSITAELAELDLGCHPLCILLERFAFKLAPSLLVRTSRVRTSSTRIGDGINPLTWLPMPAIFISKVSKSIIEHSSRSIK
jgi:hypothetical protein